MGHCILDQGAWLMRPGHRWFIYWLLILLLATPLAAADHPEAGNATFTTIQYRLAGDGTTVQDVSTTTEILNFTFTDEPLNDFEIFNYTLIFNVKATGIYQSNEDGVWVMETALNGTVIEDCTYRIETFDSGVLGGDLPIVPHHSPNCIINFQGDGVNGGSNTLTLTATVESGTPATLENYNAHIQVIRQDNYMIPAEINVTTAFDSFIPYLVWGVLVLFLLTRKAFFSAFIGTLMVGTQVFDPPLLSLEWGALVTMIALWLELMATGRIIPKKNDGAE